MEIFSNNSEQVEIVSQVPVTASLVETKSFAKSEKSGKDSLKNFRGALTYNQDDTALGKLYEIKHALLKKGKITEEEYGVMPFSVLTGFRV